MIIRYKIDDQKIERDIFSRLHPNVSALETWEKVIYEHRDEIEDAQAAIIFKLKDGKFHVITETILLFKLFGEVKKQMGSQFVSLNQANIFAM